MHLFALTLEIMANYLTDGQGWNKEMHPQSDNKIKEKRNTEKDTKQKGKKGLDRKSKKKI